MSEFAESLWVHGSDVLPSEVHLKLVRRGSICKKNALSIHMKLDAQKNIM